MVYKAKELANIIKNHQQWGWIADLVERLYGDPEVAGSSSTSVFVQSNNLFIEHMPKFPCGSFDDYNFILGVAKRTVVTG